MVNAGFEMVRCDTLLQHEHNPNRGNVAAIQRSIEANGFYGAVVAQRSTRKVLAGNHRLQAAAKAGIDRVPVLWVDADDEAALRILLADNQLAKKAGYDRQGLHDLLSELQAEGLEGTGYDTDDLDALARLLEADAEKEKAAGGEAKKAEDDDEDTVQLAVWGVIVECDSEQEQTRALELLLERKLDVRAVIGA